MGSRVAGTFSLPCYVYCWRRQCNKIWYCLCGCACIYMYINRRVDAKCVQHWWWRPTFPASNYLPGEGGGCAVESASDAPKCKRRSRRERVGKMEESEERVVRSKGTPSYVVPGSSSPSSSSSRSSSPSRPSRGPGGKQRMSIFLSNTSFQDVVRQKKKCTLSQASSSSSSSSIKECNTPVDKRSRGQVLISMPSVPISL